MFTATVITVSDKGYRGEREDTAGPLVADMLRQSGYDIIETSIVPDEQPMIEAELMRHADQLQVALIVTTGGTGFARRDITPEATMAVCERIVPGIPEAMRAACMPITDRAMLSRATAGLRGGALIVNLPGSPKAAQENFQAVLPGILHGLEMLHGTKSECAANQGN